MIATALFVVLQLYLLLLHYSDAFQVLGWTSHGYSKIHQDSTRSNTCTRIHSRDLFFRHDGAMLPTTCSSSSGSGSSTTTGTTDTAVTVPRFCLGKVHQEGATYPSPLHNIHIQSILTDEEAAKCLELAKAYAHATGRWEQPDQERHASYATCDFAIEDCTSLNDYLRDIDFDNRMWTLLSEKFGVEFEDMSYLDFFCVNYRANDHDGKSGDTKTMDRLEEHRDGSLLSFTVLLNPPDEFQGGGTFFAALKDLSHGDDDDDNRNYKGLLYPGGVVRLQRAGDACMHSGKLLHGADAVRSGERTVLVGFVHVGEWRLRPGALSTACRKWGRMDVAKLRYKRQQEKIGKQRAKGWFLSQSKWLDRAGNGGCSRIQGFCPAFSSVQRRADSEFQRLQRLEAEDILLRTILLPNSADEWPRKEFFGGDITVLED